MAQHGREREAAAWLAREYGLKDTSKPLQISVGNSEPVTLSWAKVQRRIAQLIQSDGFYTEQEQDNFDNIDPIAIREALAERGIVNGQIVDAEANRNSPFVRQVMADVERIAAQERKAQQEEPAFDPADRFHVVSLDRGFRTLYAHGLGDVSVFFTGARSVVFHYVGKNDSVGDAVGSVIESAQGMRHRVYDAETNVRKAHAGHILAQCHILASLGIIFYRSAERTGDNFNGL